MLALLKRQARQLRALLQDAELQRSLGAAAAAAVPTAAAAARLDAPAAAAPPPLGRLRALSSAAGAGGGGGSASGGASGRGARADDDLWSDPFGDGTAAAAARPSGAKRLPPQPASRGVAAAGDAGGGKAGLEWLEGMPLQGTESQLWDAATGARAPAAAGTAAAVVREARRLRLPPRQMSEAVTKALELSKAFPSLGPQQLLSAAVVRAQAGALRAEALRERARRMRRVLPDATPTISLLLGLSPEEVSQRILASVNVFRSILDTPMPVPLLDVPANLERLLRVDADALRYRLQSLSDALGPDAARAALLARPAEAALTEAGPLRARLVAAERALACGKLDAFHAAALLRDRKDYSEVLSAAASLSARLSLPPLPLLAPLARRRGGPPAAAARALAERVLSLRAALPGLSPADALRLASAPGAPMRATGRDLAASLFAAGEVMQLPPARVAEMVIASCRRSEGGGSGGGGAAARAGREPAAAAGGDVAPRTSPSPRRPAGAAADGGGDAAAAPGAWPPAAPRVAAPGVAAPRAAPRAPLAVLLMPAPRLRARAEALGELLGARGPALAAALRNTPRLLARDPDQLRLKFNFLSTFLAGADGGGGTNGGGGGGGGAAGSGGGGASQTAAAEALRAALRRCPQALQLDVSTCVERVRAVSASLRLPGPATWRCALRAPHLLILRTQRLAEAAEQLSQVAGGQAAARELFERDPSVLLNLSRWRGEAEAEAEGLANAAGARAGEWAGEPGGQGGAAAAGVEASSGGAAAEQGSEMPPAQLPAKLGWVAELLGSPPADALAAAVRSAAGRALLWDIEASEGRARVEALAALSGAAPGDVLRAALREGAGASLYRSLLSMRPETLRARAAALSAAIGPGPSHAAPGPTPPDPSATSPETAAPRPLDAAQGAPALPARFLGALALSTETLEAKLAGLARALAELHAGSAVSSGPPAAAIAPPDARLAVSGGVGGVAGGEASAEEVRRLVRRAPTALGLSSARVLRRARALRRLAAAFGPWRAQLAAARGTGQEGRMLLADDARYDRLLYLLATRQAATTGPRGGPVSMRNALLVTDAAFAERYPGFDRFQELVRSARERGAAAAALEEWLAAEGGGGGGGSGGGGLDGGAAGAPAAAAPVLRRAGGGWPDGQQKQQTRGGGAAAVDAAADGAARRAAVEAHLRAGGGAAGTAALLSVLKTHGASRSRAYLILDRMRSEGVICAERPAGAGHGGPLMWRLAGANDRTGGGGGTGPGESCAPAAAAPEPGRRGGRRRAQARAAAAAVAAPPPPPLPPPPPPPPPACDAEQGAAATAAPDWAARRLLVLQALEAAAGAGGAPVCTPALLSALRGAGMSRSRAYELLGRMRAEGAIRAQAVAPPSDRRLMWRLPEGAAAASVEGSGAEGGAESGALEAAAPAPPRAAGCARAAAGGARPRADAQADARAARRALVLRRLRASAAGGGAASGRVETAALLEELRAAGVARSRAYALLNQMRAEGVIESEQLFERRLAWRLADARG